jgi:ABC-type branched-subunit amino acid transport system ATPase component
LIGNMAKLEIDPQKPTYPSKLSAEQIISKVDELKGFIYAAHCTDDNGVLNRKLHHVWQDPKLKASQIPGPLDDLKGDSAFFKQILLNKTPDYKRGTPMVLINAKDVARPEDLANPKASCLIKMTRPCFESFKLAFQDPESRIRLNSDVSDVYYSRIQSFRVTGGYLDEVNLELSGHLNAIIGGRGTGKSTLIECIRYALGLEATGKSAQKQHLELMKENLGKSKARVELGVRSSKMNGKLFTIARRYGESPVVLDANGNVSAFKPLDVLPGIKIYGQNEIYEIAQDKDTQRELLSKFLVLPEQDVHVNIEENKRLLRENSRQLIEVMNGIAEVQDEVSRLPKLEEHLNDFKALGIEEKLKIVPLLEEEKLLRQTVVDHLLPDLDKAFKNVKDNLPSTDMLSNEKIGHLPHADILLNIRSSITGIREEALALVTKWDERYGATSQSIESTMKELSDALLYRRHRSTLHSKNSLLQKARAGKKLALNTKTLFAKLNRSDRSRR